MRGGRRTPSPGHMAPICSAESYGQLFQLAEILRILFNYFSFTHCFLTYSYLHDCLKAAIIYMFYYYFFRLPPTLSSSFNPHDSSSLSFPSLPSPLHHFSPLSSFSGGVHPAGRGLLWGRGCAPDMGQRRMAPRVCRGMGKRGVPRRLSAAGV